MDGIHPIAQKAAGCQKAAASLESTKLRSNPGSTLCSFEEIIHKI